MGQGFDLSCYVWSWVTPHPRRFVWNSMTLVGDAAKEAAFTFGHNHGVPCLVTADVGLTLDRRKTLWEAGALPGTRLDLVMIAGY